MDPTLVDYIAKARQAGGTDKAIRLALLQIGWDPKLVEEALVAPAVQASPIVAPKVVDTMQPPAQAPAPVTNSEPAKKESPTNADLQAAAANALKNISSSGKTSVGPKTDAPNVAKGPVMAQPKRSRGWLFGLIILLIVLVIGSGGAYWYYLNFIAPQKLLVEAVDNTFGNKTLDYSVTITPTLGSSGSVWAKNAGLLANNILTLKLDGGYDMSSSTPKTGTQAELNSLDTQANPIGITKLLDLSLVTSGDSFYGNLTADSQLEQTYDITSWLNTWWSANNSSVSAVANTVTPSNAQLTSNLSGAYAANSFLSSQKYVGKQTVNGVSTDNYKLTVDKTKLAYFLVASGIVSGSSADNIKLTKALSTITDLEVWINPQTKQITQIAVVDDLSAYGTTVTSYVTNVTTLVTLSNQNGSVPIVTPSSSTPVLPSIVSSIEEGIKTLNL